MLTCETLFYGATLDCLRLAQRLWRHVGSFTAIMHNCNANQPGSSPGTPSLRRCNLVCAVKLEATALTEHGRGQTDKSSSRLQECLDSKLDRRQLDLGSCVDRRDDPESSASSWNLATQRVLLTSSNPGEAHGHCSPGFAVGQGFACRRRGLSCIPAPPPFNLDGRQCHTRTSQALQQQHCQRPRILDHGRSSFLCFPGAHCLFQIKHPCPSSALSSALRRDSG